MKKVFLFGALGVFALAACLANVAAVPGPPAPFGSVLTSFTPTHVGNGRALAFDPKSGHLFYTNAGDFHIYITDSTGADDGTLVTPATYGALSWDSKHNVLWGGRYDGSGMIDQIDPTSGAATTAFSFAFPLGDSCYPQGPGFTDGLAYDRISDTLWLSDDNAKHVFHTTLAGATISSSPVPAGRCNTGIVAGGQFLWLALQSGPDAPPFDIVRVTKDDPSTILEGFPFVSTTGFAGPEGIAVDKHSFVPNCVVWSNQFNATRLTAWAVEPGCPSD